MRRIIKRGKNFRLTIRNGQFWLRCNAKNCSPSAVRVSRRDAEYLTDLRSDFDNAAVLDFGCGVFQAPNL
jgi:hypothetical protein